MPSSSRIISGIGTSETHTGWAKKSMRWESGGSDGLYALLDADANSDGGIATDRGEDDHPLTWSLDANAGTFSDWSITIVRSSSDNDDNASDSSSSVTYHVHKNVLAVGPRRSEYFAGLFRTGALVAEAASSTSVVCLSQDAAADAFPALLDYMYSSPSDEATTLGVSTVERAVALRYLGRYFWIKRLFVDAAAFIREDLCPRTAPSYMIEAAAYHDEELLEAAAGVCAEKLDEVEIGLLVVLPPELFREVVTCNKLACDSKTLSRIVSGYCNVRANDMDGVSLETLTDRKLMPLVDPEAAHSLLKMKFLYRQDEQNHTFIAQLSSLEGRCIESLSTSWKERLANHLVAEAELVNSEQMEPIAVPHRELPSYVQTKLLETSLWKAKVEIDKKDKIIRRLETKARKNLDKLKRKHDSIQLLTRELQHQL